MRRRAVEVRAFEPSQRSIAPVATFFDEAIERLQAREFARPAARAHHGFAIEVAEIGAKVGEGEAEKPGERRRLSFIVREKLKKLREVRHIGTHRQR